ncbi:protein FAM208B isoform X1 [Heterocephalus glaber]|uniref:Protein FAM208B isoform X1 n=2 Tax=Heterocephalus glaber TaxID=10181 RepID=A0AAX6R317_HETGA|nr:protein FAM208B isoform X1 [Heterocephalus glaber]XP_012931249.1 protein FAM208B isoform X2 [Heterocephalus glaber]XP_012931250.1 protein FAM208B isoform X1 [Heterocephalus glaber]XP_012931251.1 protein FAM208B isoform X1 [Heterocephalus glaber]XP_012931253.1 protein FAM208B isoform X1 [Heterocephalus glaber]XP_021121967.1 protein FAM208B isoform X1 [Heterocephalus glaber]XP_021121968.1 protein FAM208B isoform X1 [Heterocephalus glaber]XP_021121969.1 protein FAM208B isoform X1 [Heteroceph
MAAPPHKSILESSKNVLISPWKGKLTIQGCVLCDITLWSSYGTVIPAHLPHELHFKYVMRVSSLKERLPEAAFRKQIYLEQKVCCQDLCFNLYEVELSNKQGEEVDKLTEYIKNKQLALIKCLEDRAFFILLSSSALIPEPDTGDEQMSLHVLHLFHSHLATEVKDLKIEDDISWKVAPILPALNCALLEAKKLLPEEGTHPNILVKHNFQELNKVDKNLSLTAAPQDVKKETTFFRKLSGSFDLVPPPEKCSTESLTQLKSYFSDPGGYTLEVSTALGLLAECPPSPYISDGICDAGFSLVMTPDPEFLDSEAEVRKKTQTEKSSEEMFKEKKGAVVPLSAASNLRVQPKRKASMLPIVRSKRVNLCPSFAKRTTPGTDSRSSSPSPLKLVKGQLPQKRKRGAEVVTAQVVQKTKLNRKSQEVPISKDVPVATNTKRARRQEKSPIKTVPRAKPPVKKSPQKRRVNIVKGSQNPRIGKQPQPAKEETALQLQSEISSDGQKDGISMNTAQSQSITVAQKDLPENSIINYDSQALNMLADLALSSAASSTPLCEARNLPCSSELPQNDVLHSKESSLCDTSDHDYHSGVKSQKGILLSKSSCDQKSNSGLDLTASHEEENLVPCSQTPPNAQSALREETEPSGTSQNSLITVEHSYALLLGENSKKHLQQRGLPGPAFAKTGTKGPEAGTPVGKVMPFRHLQNTSPLQKLSEDSLVKHRGRFISSNLKNIFCSHTIISCDGSFKITFKCETEYAFNLDSKYTNNPLEKTVVRALHGPWNTNLPDNMEEVKLLIHMWVALFYRNRNKVIQSSRKVVEHSNPEKYVSINSTLESFELSEIEESSSVERCSIEPLLETKEMSRAHANEVSFHGPKCLLPLIKLPPSRGLELCVENERKEIFARECHLDNSESQNFIHSCNDEVVGGKAKQESANKLEASNLVLSVIGNTQTNGPFSSDEDETFQSVDSKRVVSYNDTGTQATFTRTYDGASSQSEMCEKSVYIPLESRVDILHTTVQTNTNALQDLIQCSSPINNECESSLEKTDDNMEYVMINLEPVTFTLEKDACVPVHTEVNRGEKPLPFSSELINQMLPAADVRHPISALEEAQTQAVRDIPSLAMAGQKSTKYLSASSGKREILDEELLLSQKEMTLPVSSPSSDKALIMEALSLVKCSSYPLPSEEMKHSQDICLQTQNLFSISSEEIIEPSQIEVVSPSVSASLGKRYSNDCVPPKTNIPDDSLELRKNDKSSLNCENVNLESFNAVFAKQTNLLINGQEIGLELQEENSDIDLTLTISPPTSPRGKVPANETKQLQEATGSNLELKDIAEEIIEPKEVTLIEKTEENPASSMSAYSTVSKEPLENERKGDSLQPITLILSKENCTLEIGEEINVTSDFPYGSLIEEVSPSSSPDPLVPIEEARPSQVVSPCSLKLHGTQCEKSNKFSQIESEDIAVTEKENSFVDPSHLVRQENTTQLQQIQLSVKMPLILTNHPGRKGRLMFPGKITEEIVPREHGEGLSFSEKVQCYGTELNKPGLIANYGDNFKPSLEKLVKSGNPLQPISIENRNLGLKHLVLESHEPSFSSRKSIENKSLAEALVSTTSLSGIVNIPLKEQGSPESIKEKLCNSDLKTDGGSYMQVKSVSSVSIDEADVTQAYLHPEIPEFGSASDSATFTQCTRPESIEPGFQTQEISVIRMASLFGNSRTEAELHEEGTDVDAISLQSNSTASTKGEEKTVHTLSDTSVCEMKELLKGEFMPTYACSYQSTIDTSEEPSAFVSESIETLVYGVSKEHIDRKTTSEGHRNEADAKILDRNVDANMNSDKHYEPLSGDSDQDSFNNCRNPRLDMENSGILGSYTSKNEHAAKDGYYSLMCLNNSDNEACDYSNKVPGVKMNIPPRNWATGLKKADECMPHYVQIRDRHGILRTYANFTVTRELKDMTRTLHRVRRHPSFTLNSDLSSWMSTWQVADDLTQNTLDLEYLRFTHKIKQLVKKEGSRQTDSPLEILLRDFPLTEKSEPPVLHPTPRNRSPILVTVMHTDARWQSCHRSGHTPSDLDSSSSFWKERCSHSRNLTNSQRKQTVSFHLNKLKYNSTLKESRNDISLILNEYAEFNKVVMNSNYADFQDKELNMASEEATFQETYPSFSRQSTSYEDIITDLCASLHTKLNSVLKEACKSPFFFYLVETGDKPFFLRTKSILRKGGHTEIEPQHFCHTFHRENDTLVVIIRNEDISSHLHQIPSLLKLKHLPGVIFAGVDNPEDVLNDTHQELFHTGGFVVSDDKILETVTLAQLKEIVKILEKLNGNGRWKWLLHYRENKKLKEDVRMDSVAHKKNLILRSYQSANIIELLPYHQCDSQSQTKAEILKCLINLQIQHVDARFAVFLTDKHISSEVFGNNGILATDVNNFIENIQKIAAPFRSSYW